MVNMYILFIFQFRFFGLFSSRTVFAYGEPNLTKNVNHSTKHTKSQPLQHCTLHYAPYVTKIHTHLKADLQRRLKMKVKNQYG